MSDEPDIEYEIVGTAQERMNRRKVRASERYWEREYREVLSRLKEAEAELADWQRHGVKLDVDVEALREAATLSVHDLAALDWRKVEVMHDFTLSVLAALEGDTHR